MDDELKGMRLAIEGLIAFKGAPITSLIRSQIRVGFFRTIREHYLSLEYEYDLKLKLYLGDNSIWVEGYIRLKSGEVIQFFRPTWAEPESMVVAI